MDNQQGTPSESEIAWLAGIIEGEGTIQLGAWKINEGDAGKNLRLRSYIIIYNTDANIIKKSIEIINRMGINPHISERAQKPMLKATGEGHYKSSEPMLRITVKNLSDIERLLTRLRPWLFGNKAPRADLMLEYVAKRQARIKAANGNYRVPYGKEEMEVIDRFYKTQTRVGKANALEGLLNEHEQNTPLVA